MPRSLLASSTNVQGSPMREYQSTKGTPLVPLVWMPYVMAAALAGCVVNEAESPSRGVIVNGPPPAALQEQRPPPPDPNAAWIAGYWHWTGMQYAWIPGHWDAANPGAVWNAPVYSARDGKYFYESGGWRSTSGKALR